MKQYLKRAEGQEHPHNRRASIEKARRVLGYEPKTDIREGIKKTCDWIVENIDSIEASAKF
jgi:nucleoside-diphosphate-sugar epimerase